MRLSPVSTKRHSTLYFSLRWNWYATIGPTRQTVGPISFVKRLPWTVMIVPGLTLGTCPHERNRIALLRARMIHARPRTSSEPQPRSPRPSTTPARCPKKFPPTPIITRLGSSTIYTPWGWTRSLRRKRPAAAGCRHPRPEDASPGIRRSGTGCGASCRPNEAASATRYAWRPWSRFSARSSRGRDFRQFLLRGLETVQEEWSLICTAHNLLKLFRYGARTVNPGSPTVSVA